MLDFYNGVPLKQFDSMQVFFAEGLSAGSGQTGVGVWQTWKKPKYAKSVSIWCIGGGSGGGGANTSAAGNNAGNAGGGAGGASSSVSRLIVSAYLLPDELYVAVGTGGAGGLGGNAGVAGSMSYISLVKGNNSMAANAALLLVSGNAGPTGGNNGVTNGAPGAVSVAGTVAVQANACYSFLGAWSSTAGNAGLAGGANGAAGANIACMTSFFLCGGTGGGGKGVNTAFAGGAVLTGGIIPAIPGGVAATGSGAGGIGKAGFWSWQPLCGTGGTGGGSAANTTKGGDGGQGAFGCGGGGGGAGAGQSTGGRGGDGLVIIIAN
jgi:hypothetical protein